ncbi:MAG: DNA polymerase I [Candidatus Dojkabacteria bacterium]|jgi:DNA polymerase-1
MNLVKNGKDRFLAIDANAIVHRAFHAYPSSLQTEDGLQVNATYGFTVMLMSALELFDPKYVLCSFDTAKPTFRHTEFADYKATRKPTDQSLIDQFPMVEEILKAFNIPILKKEGYEADDILGTISRLVKEGKWCNENIELYILSGDRDLLQLVGGNVKVCLPAGNFKNLVAYDREETFKHLGYYPEQVIDFKAIAGDSSDNIPGIKGVGAKSAVELLSKYGSLNKIYENLKDLKPRQATLFQEGIEQAELSRKLATIDQHVDISIYLEDCILRDFDKNQVTQVFKKYAFKSLINRLDKLKDDEQKIDSMQLDIFSTPVEEVIWSSSEEINSYLKDCKKTVSAYIDVNESATGEKYMMIRGYKASGESKDFVCKEAECKILLDNEVLTYSFENSVAQYDLSKDVKIHDINLFAHLINSESRGYSLKDLTFNYAQNVLPEKIFPAKMEEVLTAVEEVKLKQLQVADKIELYDYTKESLNNFMGIHEKYFENVLQKIEIPIAQILHKMESRGICVDVDWLNKLEQKLSKEITELKNDIFETIGHEFNINSPKQLSDVLFNELDLPANKKGSTRESVLEELKEYHPAVEKILKYRELNKILSTYVLPILDLVKDGQNSIHTDFKQTGTTSGRFSSVNPNLQNIPAQGEWAENIQKAFVAREGYRFLGVDYSQMELRIMAHLANDDLLIKDFEDGIDIHRATASRVLGKDVDDITKEERSLGKTVNFAILFGQTPFGLARLLHIDVNVASGYIQNYFAHYVGVEEYIRGLEKEAYKKGYVQTMFGTTRHIRGLSSKNFRILKAAQREAVNMPIQGSEADIMKLAMVKIDELIMKEFKDEAHILLQIHDELIFEVKEERIDEFEKKVEDITKNVVSLNVPLDVNSSQGKNMGELG